MPEEAAPTLRIITKAEQMEQSAINQALRHALVSFTISMTLSATALAIFIRWVYLECQENKRRKEAKRPAPRSVTSTPAYPPNPPAALPPRPPVEPLFSFKQDTAAFGAPDIKPQPPSATAPAGP